eukprot:gene19894-biopygen5538
MSPEDRWGGGGAASRAGARAREKRRGAWTANVLCPPGDDEGEELRRRGVARRPPHPRPDHAVTCGGGRGAREMR